jgi:hypothetical protein
VIDVNTQADRKENKQINEPTPKKANKQTNRQATGMQNADGDEEEMRKCDVANGLDDAVFIR